MEGTLGYDSVRSIRGTDEGVVTWLPKQGATVARGEQLYRVDERPTVVFFGSTPCTEGSTHWAASAVTYVSWPTT
ncbi:hypothetical protein OIM90_32185 [Streptomyces sp. AD16]|nr:hypothetical protein OIM90_32185 [Streptomyces sp. AD16]